MIFRTESAEMCADELLDVIPSIMKAIRTQFGSRLIPRNEFVYDLLSRAEQVNDEGQLEASLERLQVNCIDLLLLHWPNDEVPLEETLSAFAELIKEGKIRALAGAAMRPMPQLPDAPPVGLPLSSAPGSIPPSGLRGLWQVTQYVCTISCC